MTWVGGTEDDLIDLVFAKERAGARKGWLLSSATPSEQGEAAPAVRTKGTRKSSKEGSSRYASITYEDFINHELAQYSKADNVRNIPSAIDGLKPGQRKVLYACLKRPPAQEVKVAQLSGFVSEHTAYHHGETSLQATIINMAQSFPGANNLPLLMPIGQFGTRLSGGKDAASARYVFTKLSPLTRLIFIEADDAILRTQEDDGVPIEPVCYLPIVPLVLINGAEGIGTGWSTNVPMHNPLDVVDRVLAKLRGQPLEPIVPWVRGLDADMIPNAKADGYLSVGKYKVVGSSKVEITELPLGRWTEDYKDFLDTLCVPSKVT